MAPKKTSQKYMNFALHNEERRKNSIACDDQISDENTPLISMQDFQWGGLSTLQRHRFLEDSLFGKNDNDSQMRLDDEERKECDEEDESSSLILKPKPQPLSTTALQLKPAPTKASFFSWKNVAVGIGKAKELFNSLLNRGSSQYSLEGRKLIVRMVLSEYIESMEQSSAEEDDDDLRRPQSLPECILTVSRKLHIDKMSVSKWVKELYQTGELRDIIRKTNHDIFKSGRSMTHFDILECLELLRRRQSLLPSDADGDIIPDVQAPKGSGERVCFYDSISIFGPLTKRDERGVPVRDCMFVNHAGDEVMRNGQFVELNSINQPRAIYVRAKKIKQPTHSMSLPDLQTMATDLGIAIEKASSSNSSSSAARPKLLTKAELISAIKSKINPSMDIDLEIDQASPTATATTAATTTATTTTTTTTTAATTATTTTTTTATTTGVSATPVPLSATMAEKVKLILSTDYAKKSEELDDMAHTVFKLMVANQSKGDYHDNFDSDTTFKIMKAHTLAFPEWCKYAQKKREAGGDNVFTRFRRDFFDWASNKPLVSLTLVWDNAPYHHGILCNLDTLTKAGIIEILKAKDCLTIYWGRQEKNTATGQMMTKQFVCPIDDCKAGFPLESELKEFAFHFLYRIDPQLVEAPYRKLMQDCKGKWGAEGFNLIFSPEYAAAKNVISVEFWWAAIKSYAGADAQQEENKSTATLIQQLRDANHHYAEQGLGQELVRHCNERINDLIKEDAERGGPLSGRIDEFHDSRYRLKGIPSAATLLEWKEKAGMQDGRVPDESDTFFSGRGNVDESDSEEEDDS